MEIIEKAPAKINLGLDVLGKRADGYHELEMVMSSVDLADRLIIYIKQPVLSKNAMVSIKVS